MFRRANLAALLVLATLACQPQEPAAPGSYESELVMIALVEAIQSADTALIVDLFWPEATYDDFSEQHTYQGLEEIVGYVTGSHAWGDDIYMNVGRLHVSETRAVAEWVFSAIQARPMGEQLPVGTGREVVLNGVTIIEVEGGRIIRAADYTDTTPMLLQLGGRIELPGGVVLEQEDIG